MNKRKASKATVPEVAPSDTTFQKWVTRVYAFAGLCLAALASLELTDTSTPFIRTLLMLGIVAAGTAAWVLQARRKCLDCGHLYGYHLRIVKANKCRKCGAEFPAWRPGQ